MGFSNLFLLTRVGQFFTLFTLIVGWDLVVLIALHCTWLLHCLGQVGPIFTFSIPEGKTTLDVFYRLTGTALQGSHRAVT